MSGQHINANWLTVKEYAAIKGISERAVRKNIAAGKYEIREVPHPSRKDQVSYEIWTAEPECGTKSAEPECGTKSAEPECGTKSAEPESGTKSAEPECGTKSAEPESGTKSAEPECDNQDETLGACESCYAKTMCHKAECCYECDEYSHCNSHQCKLAWAESQRTGNDYQDVMAGYRDHRTSAAGAVMAEVMRDDTVPETTEVVRSAPGRVVDYVPYHKLDEAQLYALLMQEIDRRLRSAASRGTCWQEITGQYNAGDLVPELRKLRGARSERGLRHWWQRWSESNEDMFELIHKNTAQIRGRKVTQIEQDYLLSKLLADSKVSIGSAIVSLKDDAREIGLNSPSSAATLKRWCNDWAAAHPAVWGQARLGDKWVKDNVIKSLIRNTDDIKFGDVLVGDGHIIGNDIINPMTGKPARLTLIMFFDWASRYPVGASLAYTEDSVHILTALRNAILQLGFVPKCVYLDNGRAFKSKLFTQAPDDHNLSVELAGILPRLGIYAHFAEAYNGRSKIIERYFKTLQEQWERFMSGFRGSTIADKPAHLMRNEKWAKKMYEGKPMEYDEALTMAYYWVRYKYGNRPNAELKGRTPYEVFSESERPADRAVEMRELDILMLKADRAKVRKDGIMLMGNRYWAPELVDYALQPVVIRYDYCDLRQIMVYDLRSRLICAAELREGVNGMAFLEDNPLAYHQVKAELKEVKALHRMIQKTTKRDVARAKAGVERELAKHQEIIEQRKAEIEERNPLFKNKPMMPAPVKRADVHDDVAALEKIAREAEGDVAEVVEMEPAAAAPAYEKTIELEDLLEDEGSLADTVSFKEMQKIIGIER